MAPLRILLRLLTTAFALELTRVPHRFATKENSILYLIQEEATVLIAMKAESTELVKKMGEAVTNYTNILTQKERSFASGSIFLKCVSVLTEQIRSMTAPASPRKRCGWLNSIGQRAKKLFGIATEDDMRGFRQAVLSNEEAIDKIARQGNGLVGVVNALGSVTKRTMNEMNKSTKVLDQQRTVIDHLTTYHEKHCCLCE